MKDLIAADPKWRPVLDPGLVPASLWNRSFRTAVAASGGGERLALALERPDGSVSVYDTAVFPHAGAFIPINERYVERLVKFLLPESGAFCLVERRSGG
jgi:hypothetical protein